jgi:hypothetical protein
MRISCVNNFDFNGHMNPEGFAEGKPTCEKYFHFYLRLDIMWVS